MRAFAGTISLRLLFWDVITDMWVVLWFVENLRTTIQEPDEETPYFSAATSVERGRSGTNPIKIVRWQIQPGRLQLLLHISIPSG
jgi:hypothetical protein